MEYQAYLTDEQKSYLLEYMRGQRTASIFCMCTAFLMSAVATAFLFIPDFQAKELKFDFYTSPAVMTFLTLCVFNFVRDFRKIFIFNSDMHSLENNLYSLDRSELGFNKKHSYDIKYQINDNAGNIYICPKYADYKADKFIYIKLENGRGYAIGDQIKI